MDQGASRGKISMFSAAFMGIGAMVGAGIFALLGEAGSIAGTAVWLSFLIAGGSRSCKAIPSRSSAGAIPLAAACSNFSCRALATDI
jgi:hypothetical protein